MPLTRWQKIDVYSPYRAKPQDLYRVMEILSDEQEFLALGDVRYALVVEIHWAATTKRIPIPPGFDRHVQNLNNTPHLFRRPTQL